MTPTIDDLVSEVREAHERKPGGRVAVILPDNWTREVASDQRVRPSCPACFLTTSGSRAMLFLPLTPGWGQ